MIVIREIVDAVVPARGARAQAIVVKTYVKFTQEVQSVGNHASRKILISVVLIGTAQQILVSLLHSKRVAVLDGIVPSDVTIAPIRKFETISLCTPRAQGGAHDV